MAYDDSAAQTPRLIAKLPDGGKSYQPSLSTFAEASDLVILAAEANILAHTIPRTMARHEMA